MAGGFGTAEVSKRYPVPSSTGLEEDDYHEGRQVNLVAEEAVKVPKIVKETV